MNQVMFYSKQNSEIYQFKIPLSLTHVRVTTAHLSAYSLKSFEMQNVSLRVATSALILPSLTQILIPLESLFTAPESTMNSFL